MLTNTCTVNIPPQIVSEMTAVVYPMMVLKLKLADKDAPIPEAEFKAFEAAVISFMVCTTIFLEVRYI